MSQDHSNQDPPSQDPPNSRRALQVTDIPLSGIHLIEASAGTGKTYTITSLVLRLLLEEQRPIESILAVTFTNAATAELKERIVARVEEARLVSLGLKDPNGDPVLEHVANLPDRRRISRLLMKAAQNSDRAGVFTIHGFAARMLSDHAFESGAREGAVLVGDQRSLVQDVVADFWTSKVATLPAREFQLLGGTPFYRTLTKIGLAAAGAFEVPLVEVEKSTDLDRAHDALNLAYGEARAAFARDGSELRELLLTAPALNRNKMRPASLEGDFAAYVHYFAGEDPMSGHPETDRWTQSKVNSSTKAKLPAPEHPLLVQLECLRDAVMDVSAAADEMADELRKELCERIHDAVTQEHVRAGTQSFDGLLSDLLKALRDPDQGPRLAKEIRDILPVAMIDEFQDTDPVQYEIFQRIYAPTPGAPVEGSALYLIGDPKQSIYAFRGADIFTYLKAASRAEGGVWTLSTSYRASPSLVRAQNALFNNPRQPFAVEGIGYESVSVRPGGSDTLENVDGEPLPGVQLVYMEEPRGGGWLPHAADEIARFLAAENQIGGRKITPRDIAVLTRTNQQAQELQSHLRMLGIPAVMHGDRSVLEAKESLELRRVLRAMAEPGRTLLLRTALATRMLGLDADELADLEKDIDTLELWTGRLRSWGELWRNHGVARAFEALVAETSLLGRTLSDRDGERRMTNFRHLLELLHEAESTEHLGVFGLMRWLEGAIADPSGHAMASEARQLRLESDADAITLTTAHKSKGLEYNIVFLPTLGSGDSTFPAEAFRFFDEKSGGSRFEMRGSEARLESQELYKLESRQESLRLGYVALTRAKHHVVAFCGEVKAFSSLNYLVHEREAGGEGGILDTEARLKKISGEARLLELEHLVQRSEGAIEVSILDPRTGPSYRSESASVVLREPEALPVMQERERTSSFSAMTRDAHGGLSRAAREGRDVDEHTDLDDGVNLGAAQQAAASARSAIADFPRGAGPGDALHAMFEHSPFAEGTAEQRMAVVERELKKRGFSETDRALAATGLEDVLSATFDTAGGSSISLGELSAVARMPEMEFSLPVGAGGARLSVEGLARVLGYVSPPPNAPELQQRVPESEKHYLTPEYLSSLSHLSFDTWSGFLRGFIDLVYEWEGKLYVVDYKSNYLGEFYGDYTRDALQGAMEQHHYLLQALLYSVAIHRYGAGRIPGYSYGAHFGGVQYLFLRGMHPEHRGYGVYDFCPSEEILEGLSLLLDGKLEAAE